MKQIKEIEIQKFSISAQDNRYLMSFHGRHYEANRPIIELVQTLQQYADEEEGIAAYLRSMGTGYTRKQVDEAIDQYIRPILHPKDSPKRLFLYQRELFGAAEIDRLSDGFRWLFHWKIMGSCFAVMIICDICFFIMTDDLFKFNNKVNAFSVILLLVFIVGSSLFHELGHASACKFFGVRHGGIGFGLYLNFPVLYTDVTEIWRLKRKERCVVNLAGVYFQGFLLCLLFLLYLFTHNDIVRYLILTMNLGFIMTLNPFFKFDGYWLASDLLGVPNLRKRSLELLGFFFLQIRGKQTARKPYLLQVNRWARIGLLIYSVFVNLFMGYYFCYVIPSFLCQFLHSFPNELEELVFYLSNQMIPPFALMRNIFMQLLFLLLLCYMCYNLFHTLRRKNVRD